MAEPSDDDDEILPGSRGRSGATMPRPLTDQEQDVLEYLVEYVRHNTFQPSIREIGAEFGIKSTKSVSELLQSLADKGWIERNASRSRGVRLLTLDLSADVVSVPHVDVHLQELSLDEPLESLALDRRVAPSAASFLVTMATDDMADQCIRKGDLLLVEPVPVSHLTDGDLVLCRLEDEASVRQIRHRGKERLLVPGRVDLPPALLDGAGDNQILGRVTAVIRRLGSQAPLPEPELSEQGVVAS
jgi:repressor LexA